MTDQMKKMLTIASGKIGVAGSALTFEAQKLGWVAYFKTPQNSVAARYKITDSGRAALREVSE